jgi:hypothetical protein
VDDDLTGRENLVLRGRLAGLARRARHHGSRQPGEHIVTEATTGSAAPGHARRLGLPARDRARNPLLAARRRWSSRQPRVLTDYCDLTGKTRPGWGAAPVVTAGRCGR